MRRAAPALVVVLSLGACAPTYTVHGYAPQVLELQQVEAGVDTRGSVQRRLGPPSAYSTFESDTWYYVSSRMEKFAFYRPQVVERNVVVVRFDENGLVRSTSRYALEDGVVVDLVTRTTPTFGRELTVLQQIFGNVGRVNAADVLGQ